MFTFTGLYILKRRLHLMASKCLKSFAHLYLVDYFKWYVNNKSTTKIQKIVWIKSRNWNKECESLTDKPLLEIPAMRLFF